MELAAVTKLECKLRSTSRSSSAFLFLVMLKHTAGGAGVSNNARAAFGSVEQVACNVCTLPRQTRRTTAVVGCDRQMEVPLTTQQYEVPIRLHRRRRAAFVRSSNISNVSVKVSFSQPFSPSLSLDQQALHAADCSPQQLTSNCSVS